MNVLMSAAASPAAISIVKHLRALGCRVVGMDANPAAEPLGRAFCDEFHLAPLATSPGYLPFLLPLLERVDIFLPFIDEELLAVAEAWEGLPPGLSSRIAISPPATLLTCCDKVRFQARCEELGLPVAPRAAGAPAVFKPRHGRGGKGVLRLRTPEQFAAVANLDGVRQQWVEGEEFTIDAMFDGKGRFVAASPRRRCLVCGGVSSIGDVVPDENLAALARRCGAAMPFRFGINIQVIRGADGMDRIIEINPRLAGSGIFSALAGFDVFAGTLALFRGEPWAGVARARRVWRYWAEWHEPA